MLRLLVLLLVLANGLYFAWSHQYLADYGFAPQAQSEPQRLNQQIKPEQMRVLAVGDSIRLQATPVAATAALTAALTAAPSATAPVATPCLQAGVFTPTQMTALTTALTDALPAGSWTLESAVVPARWIVYMGRYASQDAAEKKQGELRSLNVLSELVRTAPLAPGLSLGGFDTEAQANAELALVSRRGVKTAGIRLERAELRGQRLKLPAVSAELRSQLAPVMPLLAGKELLACT